MTLAEIQAAMTEARNRVADAEAILDDPAADAKAAAAARKDYDKAMRDFDRAEAEGRQLLASGNGGGFDPRMDGQYEGLARRVSVRSFLNAAASGKPITEGPEAELLQERGLGDGIGPQGETRVPWDALLIETRADADTTAPATGVPATGHPVIGRVFDRSVAAFLGVRFDSVATGKASYMVLSAGVNPAQTARGTAKDAEAATLTGHELTPKRLASRYLFSVEDAARVGDSLEQGLRADLSGAMMAQIDDQIVNGNGTSPQVDGLLNELTDPTTETTQETATSLSNKLMGMIDGAYAATPKEIRAVIGSATARRVGTQFFNSGKGDQNGLGYAMANFGGIRISDHLPAVATHVQPGIGYRSGGTGGANAVAAVWDSFSLVRDPYSEAASGQVALTACALWDFVVLRTAAYAELSFKPTA